MLVEKTDACDQYKGRTGQLKKLGDRIIYILKYALLLVQTHAFLVFVVPVLKDLFLHTCDLDTVDGVNSFHLNTLGCRVSSDRVLVYLAQLRLHPEHKDHICGKKAEGDKCDDHRFGHHICSDYNDHAYLEDSLKDMLGDEVSDSRKTAHPEKKIAVSPALKEFIRQVQKFFKGSLRKIVIYSELHVQHALSPEKRKESIDYTDSESQRKVCPVQALKGTFAGLIDDVLDENGHHELQDISDYRSCDDLEDKPFVQAHITEIVPPQMLLMCVGDKVFCRLSGHDDL